LIDLADSLGDRMKGYENVTRYKLLKRNPVIIRVDGKAFHTFTRGFKRPFDGIMVETMWDTAVFMCRNIQGCKLAYVQSDEISLLLTDYEQLNTDSWFDYTLQKMASIASSLATAGFNESFRENVDEYCDTIEEKRKYAGRLALFDARVFSLPREEVNNYFVWRQQDATRNSIQMVAQANFSHKELQNKSCNVLQDMLFLQKGINWDKLPITQKRGACIFKHSLFKDVKGQNKQCERKVWCVDHNIPIFSQDTAYVNKFVFPQINL
jgi:tRNA(His) 5'-end guanylyltransferase